MKIRKLKCSIVVTLIRFLFDSFYYTFVVELNVFPVYSLSVDNITLMMKKSELLPSAFVTHELLALNHCP